jgi:hypothetical protein
MQHYSDLLTRAIRSIAVCKEEKDLDTLFAGPRATALVNPIAGLDDFELNAFLIVQAADGWRSDTTIRSRLRVQGRFVSQGHESVFVDA